jgi:hypothetical protein
MATNANRTSDFVFYSWNPKKPTWIKVTPKSKDFSLSQAPNGGPVFITFENATSFDLAVYFPDLLNAVPNPLSIPAGQAGVVSIPGPLGEFQCYTEIVSETCPTCKSRLTSASAVGIRSEGDGGDDADPIIKIKP